MALVQQAFYTLAGMKPPVTGLLFLLLAVSCSPPAEPVSLSIQQDGQTYLIQLQKVSDSLHILSTRKPNDTAHFNEWKLRYPVYNLQTGDVDGDGTDDILVGVIKKTRYDSRVRKRLFIFKLVDGLIRPLWLGSRVAHPLEDFKFCNKKPHSTIVTIEQDAHQYLVAEYRWKGFGLGFIRYIKRETGTDQARETMLAQ